MPEKGRDDSLPAEPLFLDSVGNEESDEARIYQKLLGVLHPSGLSCPRCGAEKGCGSIAGIASP